MKLLLGVCMVLLFTMPSYGQQTTFEVPLTEDQWTFEPGSVEFTTHRSVPAIKGLNGGSQFFLKDYEFTDGTIEFDVELEGRGFVGINFRQSADRKETEDFYIRAFWPVGPRKRTALQYATVVDGNLLWDLTDEYQAAATLHQTGWNHVKLVISGRQMRVYVNNVDQPSLHVPILEGSTKSGGISLRGNAIFANLVIKPGATEGLSPAPGFDLTYNDSRYLRNWMVTEPITFPFEQSIFGSDFPDSTTTWSPILAEHRSLVNLSRRFGTTPQGERRLIWLKTTITSETAQERRLSLGFSDEVWVFIDDQILSIEKNYYNSPIMKEPAGRTTIDNTSIMVPLKEGENELMIAVANNFFGWGIIARLDDTPGLSF